MLNGWEFRLYDPYLASARRPQPGSLTHNFVDLRHTLIHHMHAPNVYRLWLFRSAVVATPVSPLAKLRLWLEEYPDDWEPSEAHPVDWEPSQR